MDFTYKKYQSLLDVLQDNGYFFQTFKEYILSPVNKCVILRHDVDLLPYNALNMAFIENKMGIKSSYYFRSVKQSWDEKVVSQISNMGHEVGYHYENLTTCRGDFNSAIIDFETNLKKMRKIVDISTICMHGSPISKWDSKDLWKKYSYLDYGIIGEPYLDIDFKEFAYFTDTGRSWNRKDASIRDKVISHYDYNFKTTQQIIDNINDLPSKIMITAHPQRWNDKKIPWLKEFVLQNIKNQIKKIIIKISSKSIY